jgi:4-hydroxythreonine-4-phosphate dehydrogenase
VGVTLGDPAGIGPEITLKALANADLYEIARPLVIGDRSVLERAGRALGATPSLNVVTRPADGQYRHGVIDLLDVGSPDIADLEWGKVQGAAGRAGFRYVDTAVALAKAGDIECMATAPLNKEALQAGQVPHIDHTTALAKLTNSPDTLTLFTVRNMLIFFMARHMSQRKACDFVTKENVRSTLVKADKAMVRFGRPHAKIAVAALNPHGGEHGLFGTEEMEEIAPGIEAAKEDGVNAFGPIPADAVFHQCLQGRWDAVLSLHHDQGHIASKTIDFERTISITVGLPFIRASVDHGTAFDIAGKGIAGADGMAESVRVAAKYAKIVRGKPPL